MAATAGECEPGAAPESMLVTTDSYEGFERQMSSSLDKMKLEASTISELQIDTDNAAVKEEENNTSSNTISDCNDEPVPVINNVKHSEDDYLHNDNWIQKKKHIFVLSSAGKPIYSRYGNEDKLVTLFGVMQALVSFVQMDDNTIRSIHAGNAKFVFLVKGPLILVAVSKTNDSASQLELQLTYVFNQIASMLTLSQLNKIYEQRRNYDLRRLLAGVERLIDHLLDFMEREPAFTLGAVKCLPLSASIRDSIGQAITQSCNKIKNLVFAILIANNQLITLIRMKKYYIHPADLHIIFNLVQSSESLKSAESWTPLCLPRFDSSGFLHGHVSYLSEDCQACLLLLTVERDAFFPLSDAKQRIVEKLRRSNCLEPINEALSKSVESCSSIGFPELRHYLYKCKSTAQFYQPLISPPYRSAGDKLLPLYKSAHQRLHAAARPLKLLFERTPREAILAWDTRGFELYAVFEPLTDTAMAIATVGKLLNWIKKREDKLFILNAPTF